VTSRAPRETIETMRTTMQLIVAVAVAACDSKQSAPSEDQRLSEIKRISRDGPFIPITALDLAHEYADNQVAADRKYQRKGLSVTGQINTITTDKDGLPTVLLGSLSEPNLVACHGVDANQIVNFHTEDTVKLTGAFAGAVGGVPTLLFCSVRY